MKALSTCIAILVIAYYLSTMMTKRYSIGILEAAVKKNSQYLILILPIFVGLSLIGGFILGPYNPDYAYFYKAIISVALFTIGRICKLEILILTPSPRKGTQIRFFKRLSIHLSSLHHHYFP